jgi:molybdenum cofactor biosynthesis enzyme MoaA
VIEPLRLFELKPERYPFLCQWELTCRCNLHCVMCYTDCFNTPEKIRQELSTAEIFKIMDELREAGVAELCLTGGEPLARPDFFPIYERARRAGFLVTLFTNGTLIDEKAADRLAELPPHRVEISLHGVSKEVFEAVTAGPGSFEKCLRGARLLRERGISLVLKATAMTLNASEIVDVKKFAAEAGAVFRLGDAMRPALDGSQAPGRFGLPEDELAKLTASDPELAREACGPRDEGGGCRGGATRFHIDAYGKLQLCSGNRREGYDLRKGSFREGFENHLPKFPCPNKTEKLVPLTVLHA